MRKVTVLLILFAFLMAGICDAAASRRCKCRYGNRVYILKVDFVSGKEMNQDEGHHRFDPYSYWAILWFGYGKCEMVKINIFRAGQEITDEYLDNLHTRNIFGEDSRGRQWVIILPEPESNE